MPNLADKVIGLIEQNLTERPHNQQEIAKTLLSLLKIPEKGEKYIKQICLYSIACLEQFLDGEMGQIKEEGNKITIKLPTLEKIAAASIIFSKLNLEETKQVERYLLSLIPGVNDSLENYLASRLNAKSEYRCLTIHSEDLSGYAPIWAIYNSQDYEDFQIFINPPIVKNQIESLVFNYYQERGFEIIKTLSGYESAGFMAQKTNGVCCICITIMNAKILVTVQKWDF